MSELNQIGDSGDDQFHFPEKSKNERAVGCPVCVECHIPLEGLVFDGDLKPNLALWVQYERRVGIGQLENTQHRAILNITFIDIEDELLFPSTQAIELYIDQSGTHKRDGQNLVLIPVRQFAQNLKQGKQQVARTIEGLETEHGVTYSLRNAGEPDPAVLGEIFGTRPNDEGRLLPVLGIGATGQASNSIDQVVQSVTEIGHAVPDHQSPPAKVGITIDLHPKPKLGVLFISLTGDTVRFLLEPCADFSVNQIEVVARPL
jgi:hypothetical protein